MPSSTRVDSFHVQQQSVATSARSCISTCASYCTSLWVDSMMNVDTRHSCDANLANAAAADDAAGAGGMTTKERPSTTRHSMSARLPGSTGTSPTSAIDGTVVKRCSSTLPSSGCACRKAASMRIGPAPQLIAPVTPLLSCSRVNVPDTALPVPCVWARARVVVMDHCTDCQRTDIDSAARRRR